MIKERKIFYTVIESIFRLFVPFLFVESCHCIKAAARDDAFHWNNRNGFLQGK